MRAGTFRALDKRTFEWLHGRIEHVAKSTGAAHGCDVDVDFFPVTSNGVRHEEYPPTVNDAKAAAAADMDAGPGGHCGAALQSSAAGSHPHTGTSDQPQPGPAKKTLPAPTPARKTTTSRTLQTAS